LGLQSRFEPDERAVTNSFSEVDQQDTNPRVGLSNSSRSRRTASSLALIVTHVPQRLRECSAANNECRVSHLTRWRQSPEISDEIQSLANV
jgi:hypothetical protein